MSKQKCLNFKQIVFAKHNKVECQYCNKALKLNEATVDHFYPTDRGGSNQFENYRIACTKCNCIKSNDIFTFDPGCLLTYEERKIYELVGKSYLITMIQKHLLNNQGR